MAGRAGRHDRRPGEGRLVRLDAAVNQKSPQGVADAVARPEAGLRVEQGFGGGGPVAGGCGRACYYSVQPGW